MSFHRNDLAIIKKKKKKFPKALVLKDHESSLLMTAGHFQLEKDLKRLRWADLVMKDVFLLSF